MLINQDVTESIMSTETLALLGCTYAFPAPSSHALPTTRVHNPLSRVERAAQMFTAYIGAQRVPYLDDAQHASDILCRLDKYIDELIDPAVWVKLDDLVKAKDCGEKPGQQQLLNPGKKSLMERMSRPGIGPGHSAQTPATPLVKPSVPLARIDNTVPSLSPSPSPAPSHLGPSLLHSPSPSPAFRHLGRVQPHPIAPRPSGNASHPDVDHYGPVRNVRGVMAARMGSGPSSSRLRIPS